ncbi:MAG: 3-deoxy-D-manno-octulosonic acid kinase [Pseudomonadota bacterium]
MATPSDLHLNGTVIRFDADIITPMEPNLFDAKWLKAKHFWRGSTQGRSSAHFFNFADRDMVLRHFHRGGLIGRVNRDLYLRTRPENSRAMREFDLLSEMCNDGLPVPRPVAARFVPLGVFYRADIITVRIADAEPLQDLLKAKGLPSQLWKDIGAAIKTLHAHNVYHSDLNCRNIMIDTQDKVWFIDFDKCEKREPGDWMQANVDRLHRSLKKTAAAFPGLHWKQKDWADLMKGYTGTAAK